MKNLVVMFPGQGSQAVGMGCDLAAADPEMREAYAEASEVLGYDLQDLCCQGPIDRLSRTDFTQPALLAASVGMFRVLRREGLQLRLAIGHSLGEFSALVATGAVSFEDALRIVRRRGQEMLRAADANPGGMAAVIGLDDAVVEALCAEAGRRLAGQLQQPRPGRGQRPQAALEAARREGPGRRRQARHLAARQRRVPLAARGAGARTAARGVRDAPSGTRRTRRSSPGARVRFETGDFTKLLQVQLVSPVRFSQSVKTLYAAGYDAFLEVGPGAVLTGLVKRIEPQAQTARVSDMETLTALRESGRYLEDA